MIRADRPFDRWFDLSDAFDERPRRSPPPPRPEADREWTYDPQPVKRQPPPADASRQA